MARARREPTPFDLIGKIRLRPVRWRRSMAERLADMAVTDYEIIMAQGFEIMRLRREIGGQHG